MPSPKPSDVLWNLERDLGVTAADAEALWKLRVARTMTTAEYLEWCSYLTRNESGSREVTPADAEPFTLDIDGSK